MYNKKTNVLNLFFLIIISVVTISESTLAQTQSITFNDRHSNVELTSNNNYIITSETKKIYINRASMQIKTDNMMFDALFSLAQNELNKNSVKKIVDPHFNNGLPIDCECFQTGKNWPYVWTRDLSYSADLSLAKLDPKRVMQSLMFKLSAARDGRTKGLFVVQDTGSGGSWPISSDRVVWFLGARHLLDEPRFSELVWQA
ncbi:hypothetical protein [Providencia stuartii]|uniref:hypothetical protein n=1 Tax=Providencia stuartii TaxID=588 RepID=UPI00300CAEF1